MSEDGPSERNGGAIDCDVHLVVPSVEVLMPYLTDHWRAYIRETAFKGPTDTAYPRGAAVSGAQPGGDWREPAPDLAELRVAIFDSGDTELAILTCAYAVDGIRNPFAAAALASAVNDWQIEHWLEQDSRLRGSVVIPSQDPQLAAEEIARVGGHPGFVQVHLPVQSEALYGTRRYYPIYEAVLRHDLAIGIHFGGGAGNPPTAVGWPTYYAEAYVGMAAVFQSQLIGLVAEGAFDRFPTLRVVLIESGVSWLPPLLWRIDKEWKGLRREIPWVRRLPSEYVREHVRLTTAPFDAPPDPARIAA
ncbi:MAG TPA: amidohydrolase family protein, partial [Methylomirabilota bacterium]|nr:amidohydrolase family protein [Methylomirabilota bacterium]